MIYIYTYTYTHRGGVGVSQGLNIFFFDGTYQKRPAEKYRGGTVHSKPPSRSVTMAQDPTKKTSKLCFQVQIIRASIAISFYRMGPHSWPSCFFGLIRRI